MTTLTPLSPRDAAAKVKAGAALIDIREPDEFAREHIAGAASAPLSRLEHGALGLEPAREAVFLCKSGMRTRANCDRLAAQLGADAYFIDGGLDAWRAAGLPVAKDARAPLEITRQVHIVVGGLSLIGAALALSVDRGFALLPALLGAGLLFAGVSGWCGMAKLLSLAPWNRRVA